MNPQIAEETKRRWATGNFYLKGLPIPSVKKIGVGIPYEDYMTAWPVGELVPGDAGQLVIEFPANVAEASELHRHDYSDRIIRI